MVVLFIGTVECSSARPISANKAERAQSCLIRSLLSSSTKYTQDELTNARTRFRITQHLVFLYQFGICDKAERSVVVVWLFFLWHELMVFAAAHSVGFVLLVLSIIGTVDGLLQPSFTFSSLARAPSTTTTPYRYSLLHCHIATLNNGILNLHFRPSKVQCCLSHMSIHISRSTHKQHLCSDEKCPFNRVGPLAGIIREQQ